MEETTSLASETRWFSYHSFIDSPLDGHSKLNARFAAMLMMVVEAQMFPA